jgi:hypothetical protein
MKRLAIMLLMAIIAMPKFVITLFVAVLAATALAEPPRPLEFRTIALAGDKGGTLAVVDGGVRLVNSPSAWNEWTLRETDKGWTIQSRLSREKPERRYLSVDAEGKLALVVEPGEGAYWKLTRKGDRTTSFDATIQASAGKFDGWYLGFDDTQEPIEKGQLKYKSYRPQLTEKAGPRSNLHIFIDGP